MRHRSIVLYCALFLAIGWTATAWALQPPTQEQVEQYKKDGTWKERLQHAYAIGNHKMDSALAAHTDYKLRRLSQLSQGKNLQEVDRILAPPSAWQGMPSIGNAKMFVLLIEFTEYPHINIDSQATVNSRIFGVEDTGSPQYPYESLNAYYSRSSYGLLNLGGGATLGWYNAGKRADVVESAAGRESLIMTAINFFEASHDFSQYDNDGDGDIDYFAVIWTGPRGAWASFWWGYQTSFDKNPDYTVDGKRLSKYSWQWESGSYPSGNFDPLVLIHETGHALGLPDYYDYNGAVGPDGGVGGLDMMDSNWLDHNAFSKFVLDWLTPTVLSATGSYAGQNFAASASAAEALLVMPDAAGSAFEEFFMVEHRKGVKNDSELSSTDGLLIWHVNAVLDNTGNDYKYDNSYTDYKLLRLMEADGLEEIEQNKWANAGDFYTAGKEFTPETTPNSDSYSAGPTDIQITGIAISSDNMVCDVTIGSVPSPPSTVSASKGTYADKVNVTWSNVSSADSYKAYRCTSSAPSTCSEIYLGGLTKYDDSSAVADTVHYYRVKTCNTIGCSGYSGYSSGYKEGTIVPDTSGSLLPAIELLL